MFRLQIIVVAILTDMYSFRLNVLRDTNVVQDTKFHRGNLLSNFYGEQIEFITKMYVFVRLGASPN